MTNGAERVPKNMTTDKSITFPIVYIYPTEIAQPLPTSLIIDLVKAWDLLLDIAASMG